MNLKLGSVCAEAAALWRRDAAILWPLAGVFFFLPWVVVRLSMPDAPLLDPAGSPDQRFAAAIAYYRQILPWMFAVGLITQFGTATLLSLYLTGDRPSVADAIGTALRRFLRVIVASFLTNLVLVAGFLLFVFPLFYLLGRLFPVTASVIARGEIGLIDAMVEGVALSRGSEPGPFRIPGGRAWALCGLALTLFCAMYASAIMVNATAAVATMLGLKGIVGDFAPALAEAGTNAVLMLASALVQVVVYRRLTAPRQGI